MDGVSKRPYTICGTERFATSRSQASKAEQTNRGHAEAAAGRAAAAPGDIEVDVKDETARSFYARFGFRSLTDDRLHMFLPMETARQAIGKA